MGPTKRENEADVRLSFAKWIREAIGANRETVILGAIVWCLLQFTLIDAAAQIKGIREDIKIHGQVTLEAIQRRDVFEATTAENLHSLVILQRQTCVNTAKNQQQIDECLRLR